MTDIEKALRRLIRAQAQVIREVMAGGDGHDALRRMYEAGDALIEVENERPVCTGPKAHIE